CAHKALGINIIIKPPTGNGGYCNRRLKYIRSFEDTSSTHKTSITPAPDTYAIAINIWLTAKELSHRYLVSAFQITELQICFLFKLFTTTTGTGTVCYHYNIT